MILPATLAALPAGLEAVAAPRKLRAGPITVLLEEGGLRYLRVGDQEILRRIYLAVRDRNWGTLPATITITAETIGPDHFHIEYSAVARRGEIDFRWQSIIAGTPDGRIQFTFDGIAHSDFLRNRIGFCILHPPECAGRRARIRRSDGEWRPTEFPKAIAATNPFLDLTGLAHETPAGDWVRLEFEGDLFETEDQRNWADASFKTFCTPLRLSYPAEVRRDTRVQQTARLAFEGKPPASSTARARPTPLRLAPSGEPARPLFPLGVALPQPSIPLGENELERLRALQLSHLRIELKSEDGNPALILDPAGELAKVLSCGLEIAVFLRDAPRTQLTAIAACVATLQPPVHRWLIHHDGEKAATNDRWVRLAREHLAGFRSGAQFGAGTDFFFMELNRARPATDGLDFLCFSLNPQVHAFDRASLVETLEMHRTQVENASENEKHKPVVVSPVTLRMRSNPVATGPVAPADNWSPANDSRQMSLFGAGWTLGSMKYLAEAGASSVTLFEAIGPRGVMETSTGSTRPDLFPSIAGAVFPLYHVLADLGDFRGGEVIPYRSEAPLEVLALGLRHGKRHCLLVANLTENARTVELGLHSPDQERVRRLHIGNAVEALKNPAAFRSSPEKLLGTKGTSERVLAPFEFLRIDWTVP